ncbi:RNA polymerase sigma-70 factor [Siphonobacter sp. BAB-5405]|uniref:RNA polymerase sigma-70 factor n=1 Tax=Siphonobacter sp. BAB-5405 TaxID=1864825 RepID=UPI000C7FEDB3|nr:RNA polymerase sigma-70 factor [Siphonobacter sp. BAB-5405]PMD88462.1 RNA polymerase sigma-70 factor [Siphonobacter sp. BAB-5405]
MQVVSFEQEFEQLFKTHVKKLHAYAYTLVKDDVMAEEMVQNVFCRLWEKKLLIRESTTGYLYRAVYHESLNYLKHVKVEQSYLQYAQRELNDRPQQPTHTLELVELEERLNQALRDLPEKCRTVFHLCRVEELKYQQIADLLEIPVKTVENQMGKALRFLRQQLADYLPLLGLLVWLPQSPLFV